MSLTPPGARVTAHGPARTDLGLAVGTVARTYRELESGPARKVYERTPTGRTLRADMLAQWRTFTAAAEAVGRAD